MAHRIEPLHASMPGHNIKMQRVQQHWVQRQVREEVQQNCQDYVYMLENLKKMIQDYLIITDDLKQRGALTSLELVGSTAQLRDDTRSCIWIEDVWSER